MDTNIRIKSGIVIGHLNLLDKLKAANIHTPSSKEMEA